MEGSILEVRDLKKTYKTPAGILTALDQVSLSLETGRTLGIVGESGCGKTTLGRCILRLTDADRGEILFQGQHIEGLGRKEMRPLRREMQMVFQNPFSSLDPRNTIHQTLFEAVALSRSGKSSGKGPGKGSGEDLEKDLGNNRGNESEKEIIEKRILELVALTGLERHVLDAYPHELDGGQCQRVGIARALAPNPKLIICDEPVSSLDVSVRAQILNLLLDLQEELGLSCLFISHDLQVVRYMAEQIAVMYLGRIVETGPADELFDHPLHPYTKALIASVPLPVYPRKNKPELLKGEVLHPVNLKNECRFVSRCPLASEECRRKVPELQEVRKGHYCACCKLQKAQRK